MLRIWKSVAALITLTASTSAFAVTVYRFDIVTDYPGTIFGGPNGTVSGTFSFDQSTPANPPAIDGWGTEFSNVSNLVANFELEDLISGELQPPFTATIDNGTTKVFNDSFHVFGPGHGTDDAIIINFQAPPIGPETPVYYFHPNSPISAFARGRYILEFEMRWQGSSAAWADESPPGFLPEANWQVGMVYALEGHPTIVYRQYISGFATVTPVPLPPTIWLLLSATGLLGVLKSARHIFPSH